MVLVFFRCGMQITISFVKYGVRGVVGLELDLCLKKLTWLVCLFPKGRRCKSELVSMVCPLNGVGFNSLVAALEKYFIPLRASSYQCVSVPAPRKLLRSLIPEDDE